MAIILAHMISRSCGLSARQAALRELIGPSRSLLSFMDDASPSPPGDLTSLGLSVHYTCQRIDLPFTAVVLPDGYEDASCPVSQCGANHGDGLAPGGGSDVVIRC